MDRSLTLMLIGDRAAMRLDARIVLIAEKPLSFAALQRLDDWLKQAGLHIKDVLRIENTLPADRRITTFDGMHPHMLALHDRISALVDPVVLVPMCDVALWTLVGKGRVPWQQREGRSLRPDLRSWRGSILEYKDRNGRRLKVIPTLPPAVTFGRGEGKDEGGVGARRKAAQYHRLCVADWHRIAADSRFYGLQLPQRELRIAETTAELDELVSQARAASACAFDIETPRVRRTTQIGVYKSGKQKGKPRFKTTFDFADVACISFAFDSEAATTVPLTEHWWGGAAGRQAALAAVARILGAGCAKIAQNGGFDVWWMQRHLGIAVRGWIWDTRAMSHCLDATAMHDLATLASLWTREPYYKDETKDPDSLMRFVTSDEALFRYCARDSAVTFEVWQRLLERLEAISRLDVYRKRYGDFLEPLMALSLHGVRLDGERQTAERERVRAEQVVGADVINALVPGLVGAGGGVSPKALGHYLYEELRLPKQHRGRGKERRVTTGEVALKRLANQSTAVRDLAELVLRYRGLAKQFERFAEGKVSADGKMRSLFTPYTDTGRLASQETPTGEGMPQQNIPRGSMRQMFVPDL